MMSKLQLIAIHGSPGAGKTTLSDYLWTNFGILDIAFADGIYHDLSDIFSVSVSHLQDQTWKKTPLNVLQNINAEDPDYRDFLCRILKEDKYEPRTSRYHARKYGQEYMDYKLGEGNTHWADKTCERIKVLASSDRKNLVVSDLRQPKEVHKLRELAAVNDYDLTIVRIVSDLVPESTYVAEKPLADAYIDLRIENKNGHLAEFLEQARKGLGL